MLQHHVIAGTRGTRLVQSRPGRLLPVEGEAETAMVMRVLDVILRRDRPDPEIPVCPDHKVEMRLRGKFGRPTRFSAQTEEEYTLIYFCPVEGCNNTDTRKRVKTQIPVAGETPPRPLFARRDD